MLFVNVIGDYLLLASLHARAVQVPIHPGVNELRDRYANADSACHSQHSVNQFTQQDNSNQRCKSKEQVPIFVNTRRKCKRFENETTDPTPHRIDKHN
jgi:hypothetical protein